MTEFCGRRTYKFGKTSKRSVIGSIALALVLSRAVPAMAQQAAPLPAPPLPAAPTPPPTVVAPPVCLTAAVKGGADDKREFSVVAPADKAEELRERGFVVTECAAVRKVSNSDRQRVCATAAIKDRALVALYWQRYRLTADEMCRTLEPATKR